MRISCLVRQHARAYNTPNVQYSAPRAILGHFLHYNNCFYFDGRLRIQAANKAWCMFGRFQFTETDIRFRALVFKCAAWSAQLSALTAFALTDYDYAVFDTCIGYRGRELMKRQNRREIKRTKK
eukprot:9481211-Pyramimonas_sp.AAC.1